MALSGSLSALLQVWPHIHLGGLGKAQSDKMLGDRCI